MPRILSAWLVLLSAAASAQPLIHRCVDAAGAVSYQQFVCPPESTDRDTIPIRPDDVRLAREPPSPLPAVERAADPQPPPAARPPPRSFRCVASDGTVFYRHDGCPAQISVRQPYAWVGETSITLPVFVPVQAQEVDRRTACRAIYDRGADRRGGSEHDERYSVYQRATGRDPCR